LSSYRFDGKESNFSSSEAIGIIQVHYPNIQPSFTIGQKLGWSSTSWPNNKIHYPRSWRNLMKFAIRSDVG